MPDSNGILHVRIQELESILVNREDEKYHVQMEGQAPELTPKHRNLRGKDYFNSKNIDKNDK